jgi:hypothetical protein
MKQGAHGGTMGSSMSNREDALIMWRDPGADGRGA